MTIRRRTAVVLAAGVLTLGMATVAMAADSVTQSVTAGTRTAAVADLVLTPVAYSHTFSDSPASMTLSADDSTGTGDGWKVTVQSSAFVHTGGDGTTDIAATNFALDPAAAPVFGSGQAIDLAGSDAVPTGPQLGTLAGVSGTLDTARTVIRAGAGYGQGSYTQALDATLTIPAQSRAGTYTGTLTTTITAAP